MSEDRRRRLLIVTYYWPPSGGGGVQRWLKMTKYLPEFGIDPVVYTPSQPDFSIRDEDLLKDVHPDVLVWKRKVWEPYGMFRILKGKSRVEGVNSGTFHDESPSFVNRLAMWARGNIFIPDPRVTWVRPSVRYLSGKLKGADIETIITTGPPHSMHLIGLKLKRRFPGLQWIVDFRDPWLDQDYLDKFKPGRRAMRKQAYFEQEVLQSADKVLTVSPSWGESLRKRGAKKVAVVTNGYDPDDFAGFVPQESDKFTIFYGGIITSMRQPGDFWAELEDWLDSREEARDVFRLILAGTIDPGVRAAIEKLPLLRERTEFPGYLGHGEILRRYQTASTLLLLLNRSANSAGHIPGKFFEYSATGKPILAFGDPGGDVAGFLRRNRNGVMLDYGDRNSMRSALDEYFNRWQKKEPIETDSANKSAFDRRTLAGEVAKLVKD